MADLREKILAKFRGQKVLSALATVTEDGKPWVRYLMVTCDPDTLCMWTTTSPNSRKVTQVRANPEVHLTLGVRDLPTAVDYLQVQAVVEVLTDTQTKHKFWTDDLTAYVSGPDDPNYAVIRFTPYRIEYQTRTGEAPEVWEA